MRAHIVENGIVVNTIEVEGLGFPVGDAVYAKTELELSISNFLSVLAMLGPGEHDFEMSVTDMEGNATTKTVMFRFN